MTCNTPQARLFINRPNQPMHDQFSVSLLNLVHWLWHAHPSPLHGMLPMNARAMRLLDISALSRAGGAHPALARPRRGRG